MNFLGRGLAGKSQEYTKKQFKASTDGLVKGVCEIVPFVALIFNNNTNMAKNLNLDDLEKERAELGKKQPLTIQEAKWLDALNIENKRREDELNQAKLTLISFEANTYVELLRELPPNDTILSLIENLQKLSEIKSKTPLEKNEILNKLKKAEILIQSD